MTLVWKAVTWTKRHDGSVDVGPGSWWSLWLLLGQSIKEFGPNHSGGITVTTEHNGRTMQFVSPEGTVADVLAALRGMTPSEYAKEPQPDLDQLTR